MDLPLDHPVLPRLIMSRDNRILKAVVFLHRNQGRAVTAKETAREAGMSLSHFLHKFPRETGYPFGELLQRIRVESACRLMESTDLPLWEIGEMCGIRSPGRLGVLFRGYLNLSP